MSKQPVSVLSEVVVKHQDAGADRRHIADRLSHEIRSHAERLRSRGLYGYRVDQKVIDDSELTAAQRKILTKLRLADNVVKAAMQKRDVAKRAVERALGKDVELSTKPEPGTGRRWNIFCVRESAEAARDRQEGGKKNRLKKAAALDELHDDLLAAVAEGKSIAEIPKRFSDIKSGKLKPSAAALKSAEDEADI